jgi:hypothetical protein
MLGVRIVGLVTAIGAALSRLALFVAMGVCSSASAFAATIAPCNSFTACSIVENTSLQLPFFATAGDVIVRDPGTSVVSDVFRIITCWIRAAAPA